MTLEDLKTSPFAVGMKETERAIERDEAKAVFIASDCDDRIADPLKELCAQHQVPTVTDFTKKEIGRACGIKVKAAACAILESR